MPLLDERHDPPLSVGQDGLVELLREERDEPVLVEEGGVEHGDPPRDRRPCGLRPSEFGELPVELVLKGLSRFLGLGREDCVPSGGRQARPPSIDRGSAVGPPAVFRGGLRCLLQVGDRLSPALEAVPHALLLYELFSELDELLVYFVDLLLCVRLLAEHDDALDAIRLDEDLLPHVVLERARRRARRRASPRPRSPRRSARRCPPPPRRRPRRARRRARRRPPRRGRRRGRGSRPAARGPRRRRGRGTRRRGAPP